MPYRRMSLAVLLLFVSSFVISKSTPTTQSVSQQFYEIIVEASVGMQTRDGVTLRADIYRPKAKGKFPVILMRTPYDKSRYLTYVYPVAAARFRLDTRRRDQARAAARTDLCP